MRGEVPATAGVFLVGGMQSPGAERRHLRNARAGPRLKAHGSGFARTLRAVSNGPRFVAGLLLSVAAWALQIATYQATALAAHFPISTGTTIAALLAVNLGFVVRVMASDEPIRS